MTIRHSIYQRATTGGHAGLSALIALRCYPLRLPADAAMPAMTYRVISSPPSEYRDHDGSPDRWRFRVQLDGWAATPDDAAALGDQMFAAFEGWSSGTAVGACHVANGPLEDYDTAMDQSRVIVDVVVDHKI